MANNYCEACQIFLKTLAEKQIPAQLLVEGLSITLEQLQDPLYPLTPEIYLAVSERFGRATAEPPPLSPLERYLAGIPWQALLATVELPVGILDCDGKLVYLNHSEPYVHIDEVIGESVFDFVSPEYQEKVRQYVQQVKDTGLPIHYEVASYGREGAVIWYEIYLSPLRYQDEIMGMIAMSQDITTRRQTHDELRKRAAQLQIVAEVSAQIKSTHDISVLIQNVCDLAQEYFGLYHVHIYLLDDSGEHLIIEAGSGEVGRRIVQTQRTLNMAMDEKSLVVRAARERQIIVSNNVNEDPYFLYNPYLPDTRSEMSIPIILGTHLVGILDVQAAEVDYFTQEDQAVQQTLADQVAIAIRNAQLYTDIHRQWEVASTLRDIGMVLTSSHEMQEVLQHTLKETSRVLPFHAASIWLKDEEDQLRVATSIGYERFGVKELSQQLALSVESTPFLARMYEDKQVIIIPDVKKNPQWGTLPGFEWIRSWAAAPIVIRGELTGRLTLDHTKPGFYGEQHKYILEVLSREISLAVENARLLEAERQQRDMAETLRDIGLVLTSSLEQEDILQLVLAQVARVLPYTAAGVWLDDGTETFRVAAHFGYEAFNAVERVEGLGFNDDNILYKYEENSVIIPDTHRSERWTIVPGFEWVRSWASAPIAIRGQLIGQVSLDHVEPGFYNPKKHRAILESLATQVSLAVGNARLFEAERRRRHEIEALQRGNMSLTASLELTQVLNAILEATFELFPDLHSAAIFLYEDDTLHFGAGMNHDLEFLTENPIRDPRPQGITYTVAQTGKSIIIEDVRSYPLPEGVPYPWQEDVDSMIGMALKIGQRVVGVMNIHFTSVASLHNVEMDSMQLLANQASIAIENARLYKTVQDHAALLETRVGERTAELAQERAQLQAILDGMAEGVIYVEGADVKYINRMLTIMTGYELHEARYYKAFLADLVMMATQDVDKLASEITRTIAEYGTWFGDMRMFHKDGRGFDASVFVTAVKNTIGLVSGAVTIIRDISQEKALQAQKDRFISHASHELRTPLTNLQTRLYLLRKRPDKIEEHLKVIEEVADQMTNLVGDLLDISRFERGVILMQQKPVILQDLIQQVIRIQSAEADRKNITLHAKLPVEQLRIHLDTMRMTQVFTNLITNAINYTEKGGRIVVKLYTDTHTVIVEIQDNGVGIADHLLPQVFQPFFRAREGMAVGTGLGLSISREIVEAHGGTLTVQSREGEGSTFIVTLPLIL